MTNAGLRFDELRRTCFLSGYEQAPLGRQGVGLLGIVADVHAGAEANQQLEVFVGIGQAHAAWGGGVELVIE